MPSIRTAPQEKIEKNENQLKENANKLIEIAKIKLKQKLEDSEQRNKQKDEEISRIISELEEAQSALGAKVSEIKDVPLGPNIEDYFDSIKKSNEKLLNENRLLEDKVLSSNNKNTISIIEQNAVEKDHRLTRYKWYAIFGSLLICLMAYLYFFPSTGLTILKNLFK